MEFTGSVETQERGVEQGELQVARNREAGLGRRDLYAMGLILVGYALTLLVMPIRHEFAILDDWAYVRPVESIVSGHGFQPSEHAQATLITHAYWGALFAWLFGMSFTSLTAAVMTLSAIAALTFYVLLRRLGFSPALGVAGVVLLTLNPYFLYLSYTFMTEITFLTLLLLTCLCYFEGLGSGKAGWLWAGSVFATLTFLTRQFGLALPLAAILWLVYARRLSWSRLAAVALLPVLVAAGYYAWSSGYGATFSGSVGREELLDLVRSPGAWVRRAAHFVYLETFWPGLLVPLVGRLRHWKWTAAIAVAVAVAVFALWQVKSGLVEQGQSTVNELSYTWLQPAVSNPTLIYCLGAALTVWLFAGILERSWPGLVSLVRRRRQAEPSDFLFLVPALLFAGTYLPSAGFLDRYWVPLLPFLIAGGLVLCKGGAGTSTMDDGRWTMDDRGKDSSIPTPSSIVHRPSSAARLWSNVRRPAFILRNASATLFVLVAVYGIMSHLDDYESVGAGWQAGRWLVSQGAAYDKMLVGYSWDGYHMADEALKRLGSSDINVIGRVFPPYKVIDPVYVVSTQRQPGYDVLRSFPYFSRLGGWTTREVYAMKRAR